MGFYIRKSVKVGPLRFNLSKSGIGVSAGIKGLRFGTGPRGNYVHIGAGGLYYRQTLPSNASRRSDSNSSDTYAAPPPEHSHGPMEEITSGCTSKMVDSNAAALLAEMDRKQKQWRAFPISLTVSVGLIAGLWFQGAATWIIITTATLTLVATLLAYYWDLLKKSVVVMYDLDEERIAVFQQLHDRLEELSSSGALWHVSARGDVYESKYHAGASELVRRSQVTLNDHAPPFVKTNVPSYRIPAGDQQLYFLPDTILVYTKSGVGAVSYEGITLECTQTRFIENGSVPHDAKVVDHTWQYVNKKGGPDRRFRDNRELPVCQYDEIRFRSSSGLNELLQISRTGLSANVRNAIDAMAASLKQAKSAPAPPQPPALATQAIRAFSPAPPPSRTTPQNSSGGTRLTPAAGSIHESLFRILCCAMVVDGRAGSIEKERIGELMRKAGAPWDAAEIAHRSAAFIEEISQEGFKSVLADSLSKVESFKRISRQDVLLRCIESLIGADGKFTAAEKQFISKVRSLLS